MLTYFIVLFIIIIIIYTNIYKDIDPILETKIKIFNTISIFFIILLLYLSILHGFKNGLFKTFIIWCIFVIATPIPEAGLLVSIPLKRMLNIELAISQIMLSIIALFFIFYSYFYFKNYLNKDTYGKFIIKIIEFGEFSIFISSIIASISMSYIIDIFLTHILIKKINFITYKNLFVLIIFVFSFLYFFYSLNKIYNVTKLPFSSI